MVGESTTSTNRGIVAAALLLLLLVGVASGEDAGRQSSKLFTVQGLAGSFYTYKGDWIPATRNTLVNGDVVAFWGGILQPLSGKIMNLESYNRPLVLFEYNESLEYKIGFSSIDTLNDSSGFLAHLSMNSKPYGVVTNSMEMLRKLNESNGLNDVVCLVFIGCADEEVVKLIKYSPSIRYVDCYGFVPHSMGSELVASRLEWLSWQGHLARVDEVGIRKMKELGTHLKYCELSLDDRTDFAEYIGVLQVILYIDFGAGFPAQRLRECVAFLPKLRGLSGFVDTWKVGAFISELNAICVRHKLPYFFGAKLGVDTEQIDEFPGITLTEECLVNTRVLALSTVACFDVQRTQPMISVAVNGDGELNIKTLVTEHMAFDCKRFASPSLKCLIVDDSQTMFDNSVGLGDACKLEELYDNSLMIVKGLAQDDIDILVLGSCNLQQQVRSMRVGVLVVPKYCPRPKLLAALVAEEIQVMSWEPDNAELSERKWNSEFPATNSFSRALFFGTLPYSHREIHPAMTHVIGAPDIRPSNRKGQAIVHYPR